MYTFTHYHLITNFLILLCMSVSHSLEKLQHWFWFLKFMNMKYKKWDTSLWRAVDISLAQWKLQQYGNYHKYRREFCLYTTVVCQYFWAQLLVSHMVPKIYSIKLILCGPPILSSVHTCIKPLLMGMTSLRPSWLLHPNVLNIMWKFFMLVCFHVW